MIKIQFLIYLIGLEPPILDEIWELEGVHKLHESEKDDDGNLDVIFDLMGLEGEYKCKARLFTCFGNVAKGSMHYMNKPGSVTR